jgi:hypothetical protein
MNINKKIITYINDNFLNNIISAKYLKKK